MKTYIRTYPVKEMKNTYVVKGVTYNRMTGSINHTSKKSQHKQAPVLFGVFACENGGEMGEFIY